MMQVYIRARTVARAGNHPPGSREACHFVARA